VFIGLLLESAIRKEALFLFTQLTALNSEQGKLIATPGLIGVGLTIQTESFF
jgi:hypothetical protein